MRPTVLLIDYDPRSIARIEGLLASFDVRTVVAKDAVAGLVEFVRLRPELTLIQDLIPRRHGFELCRDLKATDHGRAYPILLLAAVRPGRRGALHSTRCDDWVAKPFDDATLLDKLRRYLPLAPPLPLLQDFSEQAAVNTDRPESSDPAPASGPREDAMPATAPPASVDRALPVEAMEIEIDFTGSDTLPGAEAKSTRRKRRKRDRESRSAAETHEPVATP